jgi:uncharacterized protein with HEPN domain
VPSSDPTRRFLDIVENVERIERYVQGLDLPGLLASEMALDAVERCFSRISEAAVKLGDDADALCPGIAWHGIRRLGNYLRHEYGRVDQSRLWAFIGADLPPLKTACVAAIAKLSAAKR